MASANVSRRERHEYIGPTSLKLLYEMYIYIYISPKRYMSRVYKKLAKKRKSPVRKGPQGDRPWGPFCYACVYLQSISCETLECTAHSVCLSTRKPRFFEDLLSEPSISSELRTVWIGTLHILKGFEKNWVCSINGETIARNFRVLRLTWVTDRRPIYIS